MSDQGEKMCPLCAEEMDLTDQQLKPCKCGYEICVWCWHHIMDMAEKDDTEGRCPACRVPYDKEKIVGMAANCERLVVENNVEKKVKLQKTKTKTAEERKQLTSVRVIRRNLAYIVGLPLNLADEDLLQRKEYFGQYGRVLKVSISRTAAGSIQHFPNNTCSVYVTYSKEDEAVRCIQSVHDFTLDGRLLRACFGTTKYCHAWLRSVPCNNPDCLYLHEFGLQEDSFTKDEIISAYTRSRVQQITGSSNLQRSSGNVLPPPLDDYNSSCSASPGKPTTKNVSNNLASIIKGSPPNGTSVKSVALPAAASWGMRASNNHAPASASTCSNGLSKQKPDTLSSSLPFSLSASSTMDTSKAQIEMGKKILLSQESQTKQLKSKVSTFETDKVYNDMDFRTTASDAAVSSIGASSLMPTSTDSNRCSNLPPNIKSFDCNGKSRGSDSEESADVATNAKIHNLSTILSSMSDNKQLMDEQADVIKGSSQLLDPVLMKSPRPGNSESLQYYAEQFREPFSPDKMAEASFHVVGVSREQCALRFESQSLDGKCSELQNGMKSPRPGNSESLQYYAEQFREPFSPDKKAEASFHVVGVSREQCALRFESQSLDGKCSEVRNGIVSGQRLNDSKYIDNMALHGAAHFLNGWSDHSSQLSSFNERPLSLDTKSNGKLTPHASDVFLTSSGYTEKPAGTSKTAGLPHLLSNGGRAETMRRFDCVGANVHNDASVDLGESSIISNILSMDFDAWDDSLTSPQDLAKLLSDSDQQHGSHKNSIPWKVQNNQSRFSFARQGESKNNLSDFQPSFNSIGGLPNIQSHNQNIAGDGYPHFDKRGDENVFSTTHVPESNNFLSSHSIFSSISRDQVSAPPGFSVPSRAPPPGFSSFEKMGQSFDIATGNRMFDSSSLLRNPYHAPETVNMTCTGDIEFIDPAILAVGKGRLPAGANSPGLDMRSNVTPQISTFENETRLQLLMQRSLSLQQNLRYSGNRDQFSSINDSFSIPSRLMEQQSQASNLSPFSQISAQQSRSAVMSNGHWDGWNEVQNGNNLAVAELLRNERLGFNNLYAGLEDPKFRMPNSSDLYNRTFGM